MSELPIDHIRQYSRQLVREWDVLKDRAGKEKISYTGCHCLIELDRHRVLTTIELSTLLNLDKSTMSRCIKGLIQEGYLTYATHKGDQRQKPLCLTPAGKDKLAQLNCGANEQVIQALSLLTPKERKQVQDGLKLYATALQRTRFQKSYQIRPILPDDNPHIAKIIRHVLNEFGLVDAYCSSENSEIDNMFHTYSQEKAAYWVIEKEGVILGGGGFLPLGGEEEEICEIRRMYFLPETRGLGLGKKLLSLALAKAKEMGYKHSYLETTETMYQARNLYQKLGFTKREEPLGQTGHSVCEARFVREL